MLLEAEPGVRAALINARATQAEWARVPIRKRLQILRGLRYEIAAGAEALASTVPLDRQGSLHRSLADTLAAEVLPLLEACRFLEREAEFILAPRRESTTSRPAWLGGVSVETQSDPFGVVLLIAPGNYPLFLPGVHALQALAAGNAVLWKPAPGGREAALALQRMLRGCGLERGLLSILGSEVSAAEEAIQAGVDKVVLTGSAATGREVLHQLADTLTPAAMELSGCDAVFVLEDAELDRVAEGVLFALRLNGSATCMAPRRLFVTDAVADKLVSMLVTALDTIGPIPLTTQTHSLLGDIVLEATLYGAELMLDGLDVAQGDKGSVYATLLDRVKPGMRIAQTDVFAPVLSVIRVSDQEAAVAAYNECPYALTASIFGPPRKALALAERVRAGTVLINDMIVSTADPRVCFGGRGQSGFGTTRGREGLLAMTTPKVILRQSSRSRRPFQPTAAPHVSFFAGLAAALHAGSLRARLDGAKRVINAARQLR